MEIEQLSKLLEDTRYCREATEQIGKRFFKQILVPNLRTTISARKHPKGIQDHRLETWVGIDSPACCAWIWIGRPIVVG